MSYRNVVRVAHQSDNPPPGYGSEYSPRPEMLPPQQPGFGNPYEYSGPPPPPQPQQRYQDYFYDGQPPPPRHSAQTYSHHHYQNSRYEYDNGCSSLLRTCLGALCCCWLLERSCCCCLPN